MAEELRIVSVRTGSLVSRAIVGDDGTVTYEGGQSAQSVVRAWRRVHLGADEAAAVRALAAEGWSNGYLMVEQATPDRPGPDS